MKEILGSRKMDNVHSDIRGPLFIEANEMQKCGLDVLKLNTGNPASFGFKILRFPRNARRARVYFGIS